MTLPAPQHRDARVVLNFLLTLAEAEELRCEPAHPARVDTYTGVLDPVGATVADPCRSELSDVVVKAEHFLARAAHAAGMADEALTDAIARFKGAAQ